MHMSTTDRTVRGIRSRKRLPGGIVLALLVLLFAGGWAVWQQQNKQPLSAQEENNALLHDFGQVWTWVDPELEEGAKSGQWTFRLDGQWTRGQAEWLAGALGVELGLGEDGVSFSGSRANNEPGYELKLWYSPNVSTEGRTNGEVSGNTANASALTEERSTEPVTAVVLLQFEEGIDRVALGDAVSEVVLAAGSEKLHYQGGFAVRGVPAEDGSASADAVVRKAGALKREDYNDGHTSSVTYSSPKLRAGVDSGGIRVNLQIAEVEQDEHAPAEMIIGVPLITGDYRAEN